jgi:BlaI family transcriptional regulator, penicillinase repressor
MKKNINSYILTRQEFLIMNTVWDLGIATVKDVCDAQPFKSKSAYSTVLTFMRILENKGALAHTKVGRMYVYRPVLSRKRAAQSQICNLLDRFFEGDPVALVRNLLESGVKSDEQYETVINFLEAHKIHKVA